ncbi:MAG: hypothetical protein WC307_04415 [Candidatus Nanoarchaeia archaeon]|jgi:uncharacterized coiled-coil protein SlyX/uncharacterized protein YoxC
MSLLDKLFSRKTTEVMVDEREEVELSLDELKKQVNNSLTTINQLDDKAVVEPLMNNINKIKSILKGLMTRELNNDYNKALLIGANNARKRIYDQIMPLLNIKTPETLTRVNELIISINSLIERASKVAAQSRHAQIIFRDDMNNLGNSFEDLSSDVNDLVESVKERNEQLDSFKNLVKEIKSFDEAVNKTKEIKEEELEFRKKISSYERDKTFMSSELSRIKGVENYDRVMNADTKLKEVNNRKIELDSMAMTIVSKFSRALRKAFRDDPFVNAFLTNPLDYICKQEGDFNKKMSLLTNLINSGKLELNDKDSKRYLRAISDDSINDYINEYKKLLLIENELTSNDFSLMKKADAFERRLIDLSHRIKSDIGGLDSFKERVSEQQKIIDALKSKVEAVASECYPENVRLIL